MPFQLQHFALRLTRQMLVLHTSTSLHVTRGNPGTPNTRTDAHTHKSILQANIYTHPACSLGILRSAYSTNQGCTLLEHKVLAALLMSLQMHIKVPYARKQGLSTAATQTLACSHSGCLRRRRIRWQRNKEQVLICSKRPPRCVQLRGQSHFQSAARVSADACHA